MNPYFMSLEVKAIVGSRDFQQLKWEGKTRCLLQWPNIVIYDSIDVSIEEDCCFASTCHWHPSLPWHNGPGSELTAPLWLVEAGHVTPVLASNWCSIRGTAADCSTPAKCCCIICCDQSHVSYPPPPSLTGLDTNPQNNPDIATLHHYVVQMQSLHCNQMWRAL